MWMWFGLAVLALIAEINSGSFYMLLVALGFGAGGVLAWLGWSLPWQLLACAVVSLVGLLMLRWLGFFKKRTTNAARNADVNLDIGRHVHVSQWQVDGLTTVHYRGATWQAELDTGAARTTGSHTIVALRGARLVLQPDVA